MELSREKTLSLLKEVVFNADSSEFKELFSCMGTRLQIRKCFRQIDFESARNNDFINNSELNCETSTAMHQTESM